jgi:hypothetical protein
MEDEKTILEAIEVAVTEPVAGGKKKKPGRPRKNNANAPIEVHGIMDAPVNEGDVLEMVYSNPQMFKKIFGLLKAFDVSEVEMNFDPAGVRMVTKDFLKKSTIYTVIDGRCMNLYYCKGPVRICVKRENLEKILSTLGKNHYKITFLLKENWRSKMYMIIKDSEYNNDDTYEIDVVYKPEDTLQNVADDDTNYPIKFHVSSKHFKTRINNIKKLSQNFTIQKTGDEPLQFTYDKIQKVNWTGTYNDSTRINLVSKLNEEDIFSVSVCIDYIKPFSNSNIGDEVFLAVDKRENISFMTQLDKKDFGYATTIKIFTEINKARPVQK